MQFRPIRRPFVLLFAADQQGCGHHRIVMPAGALVAAGLIDARIDVRIWSEAWLKAVKPDVIVFQRQIEVEQLDAIKLARRVLPNAHLVYEIDDALTDVPPSSYHAGAVPPGVGLRIAEAMDYCDSVSVTTEPLAEWARQLGGKDVRVVPNYLPGDHVRERHGVPRAAAKIRVGFAGGVSHGGDLSLIGPAMKAIGTKVEWVFFGMKPNEDNGVPVEFHPGVAPVAYLDKLHSLDLDLILAPLDSNFFNECKSNLRLVEAGACSAAVIAQNATPYLLDAPPVFAYAETPDQWTQAIRDFIALPLSKRHNHGAAMRSWVQRHYTFENKIEQRLRAWMPASLPALFRPGAPGASEAGQFVVCCQGGQPAFKLGSAIAPVAVVAQIEDAAAQAMTTGADVLWVRPGTTISELAFRRMREQLIQKEVATVCALGPDGLDGFPTADRFTATPEPLASQIEDVVSNLWPGRQEDVGAPCGAAILIRGAMLSLLGSPDGVGLDGNAEAAIAEWSVKASARQHRHVKVMDRFIGSLAPSPGLTDNTATRMRLRGTLAVLQDQKPFLTSDDRQAIELAVVARSWIGPRPGMAPYGSDYATWSALQRYEVTFTNDVALAAIGGPTPASEWVIWINDTVILRPGAAAAMIEAAGDAGIVYADHDVMIESGLTPEFKPDFDYELFLARDYVTPIMAIKVSSLAMPPVSRQALYASVLLAARAGQRIVHVPKVLGTIDQTPQQVAEYRKNRLDVVAAVEPAIIHPAVPDALQVRRTVSGDEPKVTIVIPTTGNGWVLQPCLLPLLHLTTYRNYEILVVHNGVGEPDLGAARDDPRVRVIKNEQPFNWSALNNEAAATSGGEFLLFLNDDTRITTPDWLSAMVATAQQHGVGCVGARLLYPHGAVQHVGVVAHKGLLGHVHMNLPAGSPGLHGIAMLTHEAQAVTGACLLVSRKIFDQAGGFREDLSHNYNDVAFCLEVRKLGFRNVVETRAELTHIAGATRPGPQSEEGIARLIAENAIMGAEYTDPDPYWNPNFSLVAEGVGIRGLSCEILTWPADSPEGRSRVLVINDGGGLGDTAAQLTRDGAVVFLADVSGFEIRMLAPSLASGVWDIRDRDALPVALQQLGVERVVLCSLVGSKSGAAPVETLRLLKTLAVPVTYLARTPEVACPRLTFERDGQDCQAGYKRGIAYCQDCIDRNGSPFGYVDVEAWQVGWRDILQLDGIRDAAE